MDCDCTESCQLADRFTPATRELLVFTKSAKRYFDLDAVRGPYSQASLDRFAGNSGMKFDKAANEGRGGGWSTFTEGKLTHPGGAPPLDWWKIDPDNPPTIPEPKGDTMGATFYIGDALETMAKLPAGSVDLVLTSPPFLALRSYLPADHPDKAKEGGSQATPGEFIDWLIDIAEACDRVLAPHGSMCIELGDTYAGSGGAGGDYADGGFREGQPTFDGSMKFERLHDPNIGPPIPVNRKNSIATSGTGWPLAKSLSLIPELFRLSLVYGFNPLTGRQTERWRLRNVVRWVRPNPPVGALGDKFRPATSELMVFCKSAKRYFDLDAVREPHVTGADALRPREGIKALASGHFGGNSGSNPAGAPPLDWWNIPLLEGEACANCKGTGQTHDDPDCYACTCPICEGSGRVSSNPRNINLFNEETPYGPGEKPKAHARTAKGVESVPRAGKSADRGGNWASLPELHETLGAPPLDYWNIPLLEGEEETRYGPKPKPAITPRQGDPKRKAERDSGAGGNGHLAERTYHIDGGAPPLDWWEIPPGGYVTLPERVNPGEYVDGTLYIASAGCPLHEGLSVPTATAPHGGLEEDPSNRSSGSDANPVPGPLAGSVPTDPQTLLNLEDGSSDSPNPGSLPVAKRRSKASNRTVPAPATSPPDTASDRTPGRTDDTSTEPLSDGPRLDSPENRTSEVRQAFLALESYARTGHKPAELEGCSCSFYLADSTSHYAVKPGKPRNRQSEPSMTRGGSGVETDGWHRFPNYESTHPLGAPPLDWWEIPPGGFSGAHYAVFPPELCVKPIKAMCPEKVCRVCGEPSRRIVGEVQYVNTQTKQPLPEFAGRFESRAENNQTAVEKTGGGVPRRLAPGAGRATATFPTLGFSDCGHDDWRPGLVLDPFAGSGTTLAVATGHGRDAIGVDLDERNFDLALERVGPFILTLGNIDDG